MISRVLYMVGINMTCLLFFAQASWGCTCAWSEPGRCPNNKKVGPIFVGTVIDIDNPPDERPGADQSGESKYRFRVTENINGIEVKEVDVYSGRGGADCSYHFRFGDTYLVFPYESEGRLSVTICSETQAIAEAEPLLSELRARRDGRISASLYGVLRKTQQPYEWTSYEDFDRPIGNVTVELRSEKINLTTQTDKNGVYRFYGIAAGTYHFVAALPPHLVLAQSILSDPLPPVTLPDNACFQQDLEALPTSRIRGRVLAPDGTPLKHADVALFREDRYKKDGMGWWEFQGEDKGYFEFEHVTPGKYIIVFHNSNSRDPDIPYPRTFYPGSPDLKSALALTIGEGQEVLNADIHVAGGPPTRPLIVRVSWTEDPTPDDVYVRAQASEGGQPLAKKLSPGVYQLTLFRGARYTIYAHQDCGLRWEGDTGIPIGARETDRIEVDGSDTRMVEITVSLKDRTCKPYR